MPFIPHTKADVKAMLATIGVDSIEALFSEIPPELRNSSLTAVPPGMSEMEISALMHQRARQDGEAICFIGAGAYDHHIPAAVWELTSRGEFYTAYTPYQAEVSQGTLQLLYEYQSMITALLDMDVSNASLYDGASALAEAILMAVRIERGGTRKVLIPSTLHPDYRRTAHTIVRNQGIELREIPFDRETGRTDLNALAKLKTPDKFTALVIPQPNFFGIIEDVETLTNWAQSTGLITIGVVNPLAASMLKPPGQWGEDGVDICVGEGQPLGIPLSSGGPYFGFMCCRQQYVRQMPGRIVGRTLDGTGQTGYTLTLQAREQHIRRSKATSNICTNQGLMVTAATIYMALLGGEGLRHTAAACHGHLSVLSSALCELEGVTQTFSAPVFHEQVITLDTNVKSVLRSLAAHNLLGGYALQDDYPQLENALLVCATEKRSDAEISLYQDKLKRILTIRYNPTCPTSGVFK